MSTKARRWWWVAISAWALLLLGLGVWSAVKDPPTVREQSPISDAKKTIDTVVSTVDAGLPTDWHEFDDGGREEGCELTVARDGVEVTRTLTLSGPPNSEADAIRKVVGGLPDARLRPSDGPPQEFFADAGSFVAVRGRVTEPGTIVIKMTTGCRPTD